MKKKKEQNLGRRGAMAPNEEKASKDLGAKTRIFKKRIEDSILRAEMLAPIALYHEEVRHVKQEEIIHDHDLWDDPGKSNEILIKLADSAKVVDALKHLKYKAEEAKLIKELAELDTVNYKLFKQAYFASVDLNKFLNKYEMSKFLKKSYDMEGACPKIESRCGDIYLESVNEGSTSFKIRTVHEHFLESFYYIHE
ncbi:peptide chain release factor PrfB3, chloroplastic-like [Olea europaea var. sylvestris]|uniref:peptide chain release factor PrfB3, chloroplastic-like n=1 Tax=Olea europaea var. sylvestris TaxID=158386 RepID=UPI000C1D3FB9|nr:peptide chain release factor PrfB3, chloroplastic-like [Olea europaea var. sylvestris]